jgi:DNA-damage-inducible protein J
MNKVVVQASISQELKEEAEAVFQAIGLTMAEAIHLFLVEVVSQQALPWTLSVNLPNAQTQSAMRELEAGGGQVFQTVDELLANWEH